MEDSTESAKDAGLEDASTPGCRDAADTLAHLANAFKAGEDPIPAVDRVRRPLHMFACCIHIFALRSRE
jgi:hypothetical protein